MNRINLKTTKNLLLSLLMAMLLTSCQQSVKTITDKTGSPLQLETVINNQLGSNDTLLNYSFYLPKQYNGNVKLPIVFFLDPHANGKIPLSNYAELANKYGYIFIGSNTIKNGQQGNLSFQYFENLKAEVKKRFVFDESRMFLSGFSGGAKLAIIYTQQLPEIIGVAACGASLPFTADHQPNYYYAGIVGNEDFNYLESNQTFSTFDKKGFDYTSEIFDGGHQWPPLESFEMALIGFDIYSIKLQRKPKEDVWLESIWQRMNDSITLYAEKGNPLKQNIFIRQTARWFYGLKNIQELNKQAYQIENSAAFGQMVRKQQKLIQTEVKLRADFIRAIETNDTAWWNLEIQKIKKSTQQNDKDVAQVSQRLLNFLSMASYMLVKSDLTDSRLDNASKKLFIYQLVDPKNPDVYLMYANYYMQEDDEKAMLLNFNKAKELGFSDFETYKNDNFWKELFEKN